MRRFVRIRKALVFVGKLEAAIGLEPMHRGFCRPYKGDPFWSVRVDSCVSPVIFSLPGHPKNHL